MRVSIVDLDGYNKRNFLPNPKCMKISSYYKQQFAIVNFVTNSYEIKYEFDLMFIVREDPMGSFPSEINLRDERVFLIGEGMRFYDRYMPDITDVMAACRPDYTLYPIRDENKLAKAQMVQFFYNGKLMPVIQDYHSAYEKTKFTFVLDEDFGNYDAEDIKKCYNKMRYDSNVVFKFPINLDSILSDKSKFSMFLSLHIDFFETKLKVTINTKEKFDRLLEFLRNMKVSKRQTLQIDADIIYSGDHFGGGRTAFNDLYYGFNVVYEMKKLKTKIRLIAPSRMKSPFWFHFEDLQAGTTYRIYDSYLEFMTYVNRELYNYKYDLETFLANDILWSEDQTQRMAELGRNYPELMERVGYIRGGDTKVENINVRSYIRGLRIRR